MKILVLSYEYPPVGGGGGMICKCLSEHLAKLGHQITVVTVAIPGQNSSFGLRVDEGNVDEKTNLNIVRLNSRRKSLYESNPFEMLSWIGQCKRFFRDKPDNIDFDVCMAHFVLPGGEVARWLKANYSIPYVLISHGHEIPWVHPRQMFFYHLAAYKWVKSVCRTSSANFVQTAMMKQNIDGFTGKAIGKNNKIIPNGADTSVFYPDLTKRSKRFRMVFVGRLVSQKDPMTFLKALRIFANRVADFEVRILGDGKLRKKMEGFVKRNHLGDKVVFCGKLSPEKMPNEYRAAHLMVAPSLNEGMSMAAMEALCCGVYLIASRASGYEDMISENENGEFTAFGNAVELAERMVRFHDKICNYGLHFIPPVPPQKVLDWKDVSREYERILTEIVS